MYKPSKLDLLFDIGIVVCVLLSLCLIWRGVKQQKPKPEPAPTDIVVRF